MKWHFFIMVWFIFIFPKKDAFNSMYYWSSSMKASMSWNRFTHINICFLWSLSLWFIWCYSIAQFQWELVSIYFFSCNQYIQMYSALDNGNKIIMIIKLFKILTKPFSPIIEWTDHLVPLTNPIDTSIFLTTLFDN